MTDDLFMTDDDATDDSMTHEQDYAMPEEARAGGDAALEQFEYEAPDAFAGAQPHAPDDPFTLDAGRHQGAGHPGGERHDGDVKFGGYYNADGTYHYDSDNTDRDPETGAIVRRW